MRIGPNTTLTEIDAEIAKQNAKAKRLPPASDEYVRKHVELSRLVTLRRSYERRDAKPTDDA